MSNFCIPKDFIDVIKTQAKSNENEIYGWLIGYQKRGMPQVLAIIECKRFEQQSLISAIPHHQEFQEMTSYMPQGIGPIGIYHSHPASGEVFHSHLDDSTLISLSNQFPQCISIVTNGKQINYYQMGKNSSTIEIVPNFIDPPIPKFLIFSIQEQLRIRISKGINKSEEHFQKIRIKIFNLVNHFFEEIWNYIEIFYKSARISKDQILKSYLVSQLESNQLELRIPSNIKSKFASNLIIGNQDNQLAEKGTNINFINLTLNIKAKILLYVNEENKNFKELENLIRTESINNNILYRIYNSIIDIENNLVILPKDLYINFFGFYIRMLSFEDKKLNKNTVSEKIFNFFNRIMSFFDTFDKTNVSSKRRRQIRDFLKEVESLSKKFDWHKRIKKKIKYYK